MAACSFSPAITFLSFSKSTPLRTSNSLPCANSFKPVAVAKPNPTLKLSRRKLAHAPAVTQKRAYRAWEISASDSGPNPEVESSDSKMDTTIDIKLPRRSLLVEFTCDDCGERTKRLINRLAYERGVVYVQVAFQNRKSKPTWPNEHGSVGRRVQECAGCEQYHKLVDNLGIVVEYDLQEEMYTDEADKQ